MAKPKQDLMTLAVEHGEEHILDLTTGQLSRQLLGPLRRMRRVAKRRVTTNRLMDILVAADLRYGFNADDSEDLWVELYGTRVVVMLNQDRRFVRFVRAETLQPFVPDQEINAVLNHLNSEYDVAKFRSWDAGLVCAEYAMSYEHGLSPQEMIEMLKGFAETVQQAFDSEPLASMLAS